MFRKLQFKDWNWNRVMLEIKLKEWNFSISWECNWHSWQCYDEIKPVWESQIKLIDIWKKYHLNDMNAGTPEQMKVIWNIEPTSHESLEIHMTTIDINWNEITAGKFREFVEAYNEYIKLKVRWDDMHINKSIYNTAWVVELNWKPYVYGSKRLKENLTDSFEQDLLNIIQDVETEQEQESKLLKNVTLSKDEQEEIQDHFDWEYKKWMAIWEFFNLTLEELLEVETEDDMHYVIQGMNYIVATDSEADYLRNESMDSYIEDCVLPEIPERFREYFDSESLKEDSEDDWRWNQLATYDWYENEYTFDGETFYLYKN